MKVQEKGLKPWSRVSFVLVLFLCSLSTYAQRVKLSELDRVSLYLFNQQYDKCIEIAEEIIEEKKANYTTDETLIIGLGATSYYLVEDKDNAKAKELFNIVSSGLNSVIEDIKRESDIQKFNSLNNSDKKIFIESYTKRYQIILAILSAFSQDSNTLQLKLINFFHNCIYYNRGLFDKNKDEDVLQIIQILRGDLSYALQYNNYEYLLTEHVSELLTLNPTMERGRGVVIYSSLKQYYQYITQIGFTDRGKQYKKERANYLLRLNELGLFVNGRKCSNNYSSITWNEIKESLKRGECAVLMYDYNLLGVNLIGGIIITPQSTAPIEMSMHLSSASQESFIMSIKKEYPSFDKIYICPIGEWEGKDVAYCDSAIYLKYSLYDIVRKEEKESFYTGGIISIFADINYGVRDKNDVPQLNEGKRVISEAKSLFGDKVYSLSGNNVRKINFQNIIDDVDIFHVSTHGDVRKVDSTPKDTLELYNAIMGNTAKSGYVLALSKYNEDKNRYYISADDLKIIKFHGHGFVYLDACMTGSSASNFWGTYGLAKSFYLAGAANVIAYLHSINEKVAADFAIMFYQELYQSPTKNYHDTFYRVKKKIIEQYSSFLPKNEQGTPDIGIVLWE